MQLVDAVRALHSLVIVTGLSVILAVQPLHVASASELHIVTESFPPYNYQRDGQAKGLSTEVVRAVLDHAGIKADIKFYPWARAYKTATVSPNTLIYSIARIPERESLFQWIGVVAPYRTSFYKLKVNEAIRIESLDDARKYKVGVSLEDVITIYLQGQGFEHLQVSQSDLLNVRMLAFGRLDVIAYDEAAFPRLVRKVGHDPERFERIYRLTDLSGDLYLAASPRTDPVIVKQLRESLQAIREEGVYDRIHQKYFLY